MILDPINDTQCLSQLTTIARELSPTTLIRLVAGRLGSREAAIKWIQSLPQEDDDGQEHVRFISCDVPQRVRLLPDDPNCVERAAAAMMLLEVLDARTPRALGTIERPLRHTGLVEKHADHWYAVDLFPRRNVNWKNLGKDLLQGFHQYAGKPLLKFYLGEKGGQIADAIGGAFVLLGRKRGSSGGSIILGSPVEVQGAPKVTPHGFFGAPRAGPPVHTHQGVDLAAPPGSHVVAVGDGVIVKTDPGLGKIVRKLRLDVPGSWSLGRRRVDAIVYADLGTPLMQPGDRVRRGDPIALVDKAGFVHFAVKESRLGGEVFFDPKEAGFAYRLSGPEVA